MRMFHIYQNFDIHQTQKILTSAINNLTKNSHENKKQKLCLIKYSNKNAKTLSLIIHITLIQSKCL